MTEKGLVNSGCPLAELLFECSHSLACFRLWTCGRWIRLAEKRVQQLRKERDELGQIYEATCLDLENAIGSKAAEAIRKRVEENEGGRTAARAEENFRTGRRSKMQPVNGLDQTHEAATTTTPPIERSEDLPQLPEGLKVKLKEPLPREAVSPNPQKPGLSAIKVIYVVERLNDVFGLNGWHIDNEIVETGRMVVVRATLTIPKYSIAIEQFGGNENPDRGDAYKGACTDALSKCASYLGIGMDVYKGLHDEHNRDDSGAHQNGSRSTASQPGPRRASTLNSTQRRNAAPTGLTSRNMVARFTSMRSVLGLPEYYDILGRHGYREVTNIPSLEKARDVYRMLVDAFRVHFREAKRTLGNAEYLKILSELRLNPKAKLNPDQAVRVFNRMEETLNART